MNVPSIDLTNKLLNYIFTAGEIVYTPPSILWFALCTSIPRRSDDGSSIAEPSANSYRRTSLEVGEDNWLTSTNAFTYNKKIIQWPPPRDDWGVILAIAVCDSHTDGDMLFYTPLAKSIRIRNGSIAPTYDIGKLVIR